MISPSRIAIISDSRNQRIAALYEQLRGQTSYANTPCTQATFSPLYPKKYRNYWNTAARRWHPSASPA